MPWALSASPKKERLRHQAINLTPQRRIKARGGVGPLRLEVCPVTRHTRPDPCRWHHGRPKYVTSTGFCWLKSAVTVTVWHQSLIYKHFVLFDSLIGPYQVLPLRVRVDPRTMVMKRYSTFPKYPRLEPLQVWFNVISKTLWKDVVSVYYCPDRLRCKQYVFVLLVYRRCSLRNDGMISRVVWICRWEPENACEIRR